MVECFGSSMASSYWLKNLSLDKMQVILTNYSQPAKKPSHTLTSKATGTKRNVIASLSDDAVMYAIHHLVDICLQFQLYPLLFVHLVIVLGFWAVAP